MGPGYASIYRRGMAHAEEVCHKLMYKNEAAMRLKHGLTVFLLIITITLAGCSRDPNVLKKRYLDSGNKFFDRGKFKEARIMYLDALQKDQRYGPAYYRLGLTTLKTGPLAQAV